MKFFYFTSIFFLSIYLIVVFLNISGVCFRDYGYLDKSLIKKRAQVLFFENLRKSERDDEIISTQMDRVTGGFGPSFMHIFYRQRIYEVTILSKRYLAYVFVDSCGKRIDIFKAKLEAL